jgi:hypothetical protein
MAEDDDDGVILAERPQLIGTLSAKVLDADGTVLRDLGVISEEPIPHVSEIDDEAAHTHFNNGVLALIVVAILCVLGAVAGWSLAVWIFGSLFVFGIVTNAGVAFEAATFAGGTSTSAFNYHDSGTGTNAAAVTDTTLQTPTGIARVAGVQTTPGSTNVYQSVATITYNAGFTITEWGLFSAASSGTLWDRRVFGGIAVVATNAVQFSYALTLPSGGS